ncbi:MAG: RBBP9/YdeN family alpha/beta hydrolase [Candidatus Levyibacteriota bacterium]
MAENKAFIFHGTGGYPEENWFPWLKASLAKQGCPVIIPRFLTPEGQSLATWNQAFDIYRSQLDENTLLIGHSLGGLYLLRVLESMDKPVRAAIFIGASIGIRPIKFYEGDEKFSGFQFKWGKIKASAKSFRVFHSDNDPYVSLGNGQELAKHLGVDLTLVPHAGHFNASAGYTQFPQLLEEIKSLI